MKEVHIDRTTAWEMAHDILDICDMTQDADSFQLQFPFNGNEGICTEVVIGVRTYEQNANKQP